MLPAWVKRFFPVRAGAGADRPQPVRARLTGLPRSIDARNARESLKQKKIKRSPAGSVFIVSGTGAPGRPTAGRRPHFFLLFSFFCAFAKAANARGEGEEYGGGAPGLPPVVFPPPPYTQADRRRFFLLLSSLIFSYLLYSILLFSTLLFSPSQCADREKGMGRGGFSGAPQVYHAARRITQCHFVRRTQRLNFPTSTKGDLSSYPRSTQPQLRLRNDRLFLKQRWPFPFK